MTDKTNGQTDGRIPTFRVDIGLRVVIESTSYEHVGRLMDRLHLALARELRGEERAYFDFTHFQTHPCKAGRMEEIYANGPELAISAGSF
jgi:hypothetical protein